LADQAAEIRTESSSSELTFSYPVDWRAVLSSRKIQAGSVFLTAVLAAVVVLSLLVVPIVISLGLLEVWGASAGSFIVFYADSLRRPARPDERTVRVLRSEVVAPFVRLKLNQMLDEQDHPAVLKITQAPGLTALPDAEQLYFTPAMSKLSRLTGDLPVGSIGVSGARGVGKTTLLRYFSDPSFEAAAFGRYVHAAREDLRLMVTAPVHYDAREFVIHVFSTLCSEVSSSVPALRKDARHWQRSLRYLHSSSSGISLGMPRSIPVSMTFGRQRSELPMTLPELIAEMRKFASRAIELRQSEFRKARQFHPWPAWWDKFLPLVLNPRFFVQLSDAPFDPAENTRNEPQIWAEPRLVIGIDELDKMDSGSARDFLNEIKAIFGIPSCLYLVSVSDEALRLYEQRMIFGRTAFDSAFDEVVRVEPLDFDSCRQLMRRRIAGLPDSLIAFCHVMSGGVPRDMIRVSRSVLDSRGRGLEEIPSIVRDVVDEQISVTRQAAMTREAGKGPAEALSLRVSLYFYETVADVFITEFASTVKLLRTRQRTSVSQIDQLARAWTIMSNNPELAQEMITKYREARGLQVPAGIDQP
ncbi:MAG: hypothetical protein ACRDP7_46390, partial [Trebonia sp.]